MELRQKVFVLIAWFRGHRSEEFNSTHLFGDRGAQLFLAFCNSCPRGEMTKLMKDYVLQFLKDIGSTFEDFSAQVDALNAANATKFSKAYYLGFCSGIVDHHSSLKYCRGYGIQVVSFSPLLQDE
mmetsp:Transcript_31846/g.64389  ORF Transcript_31846/g.64389 Transcript_31846/m.64389 type:complete len:125 (-) Transcript_31846:4308-4682(-)